MRTFAKRSELERSDRDTYQAPHFETKSSKQAADLAVLPLIESDLKPAVPFAASQEPASMYTQIFFVDLNPTLDRLRHAPVDDRVDLNMIGLMQMRFGRGDAGSPLGVVGQE